jgi:hypothetical protein
LRYSLHIKGLILVSENLDKNDVPALLSRIDSCNEGQDDNDGKIVYWELKYKYDSAIGNMKDAYSSFQQYHKYDKILEAETGSKEIRNLSNSYQLKNTEAEKDILEKNLTLQKDKNIYQRGFFIVALISMLGLFIAYFFTRKSKQAKKDIELKRLVTENELKTLRAQINPHFIQNTFDFIATGMRNSDTETNVRNIKSLSNYMREVLYKSDKSVQSLEDELVFVEKYLHTQQMLFPGLFKYTVHVGEEVDTIGINLPTMLLQPIVENSIKHGFYGLKDGGEINITVSHDIYCFKIVIEDNGRDNEKPQPVNYESKGLELTQKKLETMYYNAAKKPIVLQERVAETLNYRTTIKIFL